MAGADNNNDKKGITEARCFVCDDKILGRYYTLATCKTQISQTRVIQKLGELVGERYMFVISEDDVICRNCALLINTFDRLEMEMRDIRDSVLRFIKIKYALTDGDLQDSNNQPKPCQPPQITRSNVKEIGGYRVEQNKIDLKMYSKTNKMQKKSHSWLQCDKCKYTTQTNSFKMYHKRDHLNRKIFCDKCHMGIPANQKDRRHDCGINELGNKENNKDNSNVIVNNDSMEPLILEATMQPTLLPVQVTPPPLIGSSSCDHLYISNVLSVTPTAPTSSEPEAIYVSQQDVIDMDGSSRMTKSEPDIVRETEVKTKREDVGRTFTLTEDGNLEIVEMACWNKM